MLRNYAQNSDVSVTKEVYFEMCEALGEEPVEENIPVDLDDFPAEVQHAFLVYHMMRDEWGTMSGDYLGKSYLGINEIMYAADVEPEDVKFMIRLVRIIDDIRKAESARAKQATKPAN